MARQCKITGRRPQAGQNVSHANNKTKRRFLPNLQNHRFQLPNGQSISLRLSARGLRIIDKLGLEKALTYFEQHGAQ